jgi:CheY-like chemotaxis protein
MNLLHEESEPKKKILIVDDDRLALIILERILTDAGYTVVQATNGKDALAKAKEERPDLALLDIDMPEMDGIDLAASLKKDRQTQKIPIIFLSASSGNGTQKEINSLPGCRFINKGLQTDDLLRKIKEHIEMCQNIP